MTLYLTSSSLERVNACPGSLVIGGYPDQGIEAENGTRNHVKAEMGDLHPKLKALMDVGEPFIKREAAFVLDTKARRVRSCEGFRAYGHLSPHEIGTSPDWIGRTSDWGVRIIDFKSRKRVTHPRENLQIITQAVAVFETYGCNFVEAGLGYLDDGYYDSYEFSRFELPGMWAKLEEIVRKANAAKATQLQTGEHCQYCRALMVCPAQKQALTVLMTDGEAMEAAVATMPDAQVAKIHTTLLAAEKLLSRVDKAIRARARAAPVDLGNGKELRLVECTRNGFDADLAKEDLKKAGQDLAKYIKTSSYDQIRTVTKQGIAKKE